MMLKLKWVAAAEAIVIVILLAALLIPLLGNTTEKKQPPTSGLLSQRIYSGLLEPKSFLIVNFAPLKRDLEFTIKENNINASIYVENLRDGAFMGINEKTGFFPASLNKLPVAILIMKKIERGELGFDSVLQIKDTDRTESFGTLYQSVEKELPLKIILEKLLKESDNTALRILLRYVDLEDFQLILDYYGIDITIYNDESGKSTNLISPKSTANLLRSLYFSSVLNPDDSEYILSLLTETAFDVKSIANIPSNVTIAHKFGENFYDSNNYFHDCGIMYIQESRILYCIMTHNPNQKKTVEFVGFTLNQIYNYVIDSKARYEAFKK